MWFHFMPPTTTVCTLYKQGAYRAFIVFSSELAAEPAVLSFAMRPSFFTLVFAGGDILRVDKPTNNAYM